MSNLTDDETKMLLALGLAADQPHDFDAIAAEIMRRFETEGSSAIKPPGALIAAWKRIHRKPELKR